MKRLVIETSEKKKAALESTLKEQGLSLSEWINDKIDEYIEEPIVEYEHKVNDITSLQEIADSEATLKILTQLDWSFKEANTKYLSHNIHPYPAKYIPQIPNQFIRLLSLPGERVWDPFGGSGTTALEALLLNRQAVSSDINPLSEVIGKAKTTTITIEEEKLLDSLSSNTELLSKNYDSFLIKLKSHSNEIATISPEIPNQEKWFQESVWNELGYIKWSILQFENQKIKDFLLSIFSKIIIRVSNQESETRYVSKLKSVDNGNVLKLFSNEIKSVLPKIKKLGSLIKFRSASFITTDLRSFDRLPKSSIDLIVTSPPYPNATDYHLYHRFRLFWLDFDPVRLGKNEIGSHLRHQKEKNGIEKYIEEMGMCLANMHAALRPSRYAVLVIGDAVFKGEHFKTAELVGEIAENLGFEKVGIFKRAVHSTKRSFIPAARRLRDENILLLKKKESIQNFILHPPPYKLWEYENDLSKFEIRSLFNKSVIKTNDSQIELKLDTLQAENLKRLTFVHGFEGGDYNREATWQAILENGEAIIQKSKRKDSKYVTHGLHEYKGKFYPQLAKSIFNIAKLNPKDKILDPFCGSGTVLLEGFLNGYNGTGFDLNPIALKIAEAKTKILKTDSYLVDRILGEFIFKLENMSPDTEYRNSFTESSITELESWFPINVLKKISSIVGALDKVPNENIKNFLEVCLSSIVRSISQQDPKDLRIRRRKEPIKDAPVFELLIQKIKSQRGRLRHFAERSNKSIVNFGSASIIEGDSRDLLNHNISKGEFDCVVTSPPYATALPYVDTDRLSILLLFSMLSSERRKVEDKLVGAREIRKSERNTLDDRIKKRDFKGILSNKAISIIEEVYSLNENADVGFRKKNTASLLFRYYEDLTTIMKNLDFAVKEAGSLFFIIGDTRTYAGNDKKEIKIKSGIAIKEIGKALGWKVKKTIPITVTQENRHHNKNSILDNDIIWFEK